MTLETQAEPHPIELFFSSNHPLSEFLEMSVKGYSGNKVEIITKANEAFISNGIDGGKDTLHTGFATIVLDSIMGGVVMGVLEELQPIATVSLSVQHLRRPKKDEEILGRAFCSGIYNDLAYVTGELLSQENDEVLAIASGTFMIGTRAKSIRDLDNKNASQERRI